MQVSALKSNRAAVVSASMRDWTPFMRAIKQRVALLHVALSQMVI